MSLLPEYMLDALTKRFGADITEQIEQGMSVPRSTTFRVNTLKAQKEEVTDAFSSASIALTESPFWDLAFIVQNAKEKDIWDTDVYQEGKIYLQSLSSMLPPLVLDPKENQDILDMAAAPGGKTTEIAMLTENRASLTACEVNKIRAEKLKYNLEKQGAKRVSVMVQDASKLENFFRFDKILLDAPCSGSGTLMLNDPASVRAFSPLLVKNSSKIQLSLLKKALKILKSGGEMVYSTCSILEEENESIVRNALKGSGCELVPISFPGIDQIPVLKTSLPGCLLVRPTELYEGFFMAKFKKVK